MYFNKLLYNAETAEGIVKMIHRTAVRAVIIRKGRILLVHSNQDYYKLPGGGVEDGESYLVALLREVAEETGYINCAVKNKIGIVTEKRLDQFEKDGCFQMDSHYYLCELTSDEKIDQRLDDYEWEQGFTAVWCDIDEAIQENQIALEQGEAKFFIHRENFVLAEVKRNLVLLSNELLEGDEEDLFMNEK